MSKYFCIGSYKRGNIEYFKICKNDGTFSILPTTKLKKFYNGREIKNLTFLDSGKVVVNRQYAFFYYPCYNNKVCRG